MVIPGYRWAGAGDPESAAGQGHSGQQHIVYGIGGPEGSIMMMPLEPRPIATFDDDTAGA